MDKSISLDEYINMCMQELLEFKRAYLKRHNEKPNDFKLELTLNDWALESECEQYYE